MGRQGPRTSYDGLIGQPLFREFVAMKKIVLGPRFGITEVMRRNVRPKSGFTLILHELVASPTRLGEIPVRCSVCDLSGGRCGGSHLGAISSNWVKSGYL